MYRLLTQAASHSAADFVVQVLQSGGILQVHAADPGTRTLRPLVPIWLVSVASIFAFQFSTLDISVYFWGYVGGPS